MSELTEIDIRLHALNLAVAQRREVFRLNLSEFKRKDDDPDSLERKEDGWLARETLTDARLYAEWLTNGDVPVETPEQSATIIDVGLERMGVRP